MSEERFTDIWCSETGHIGVTDYGIDKEFTSIEFEDFLNELNDENKTLKKENEWLRKELKGLNRKYIAFSEATDKRLKEMMKEMMK